MRFRVFVYELRCPDSYVKVAGFLLKRYRSLSIHVGTSFESPQLNIEAPKVKVTNSSVGVTES